MYEYDELRIRIHSWFVRFECSYRKAVFVIRICLLVLLFPISLFAQDYWQQEVNYEIHVSLDDRKHQLHASETIEYINNSNTPLTFIWFHLWPNAYQDGRSALSKQMRQDGDLSLYFSNHRDRGWIDSLDFHVNGEKARFEVDHRHQDMGRLFLDKPLQPGERITITTPFRVQIPKGIFSRLGHLGQAYQITQWYPKPAVFDKSGWHQMPYLGQGEFYSEYGSFDVHITLPENYVVGATGDLVKGETELAWLNGKVKETEAITEFNQRDLSFPESSPHTKTLHYHQQQVHDFAWFADKRYHVLKGEVALPVSGRKVTTWAMFTNNEAHLWKNAIEYLNDATYYYSLWVGEYAYNHVTAVDGVLSEGGGMEYPNVTIIGESGDAASLEEVIMHEIGHNWFYGMLGSNERDHPWMDEGLNSFIELRYMQRKHPNLMLRDVYGGRKLMDLGMKWAGVYNMKHDKLGMHAYTLSGRGNTDQPIELHSNDYTSVNYGTVVYMKTAIVFNYLMQYLGTDKMNDLMLEYFERWKFKHPQPEDFEAVAQEVVGDSLKWFFDDLIRGEKKMDYAITQVKKEEGKLRLKVTNIGRISAPFPVSTMLGDEVKTTQWFAGIDRSGWIEVECSDCDAVVIDSDEIIPDINRKNNQMRVNGIFRKTEKLQPRFVLYYENPKRSQFAYSPILGWNNYDGFMLGAAVYNNLLPINKFDYTLMPMYAFGSNTFTGYGKFAYTFHQNQRYPNVTLSLEGQRFDAGQRPSMPNNVVRPELSFHFLPNKRRSNITHDIRLRDNIYLSDRGKVVRNIPQITYGFNYGFAPHFAEVNADLQWVNSEAKLGLEAIYRFKFKRGYGIRARLFFGKFILKSSSPEFNFRMSSQKGSQEYLYEGTFLGRFENNGFLSQQTIESDGGFKSYFRVGQTSDWLLALNLSSSLYRKIPIELFMSVGTYADAKSAFPGSQLFLVEFGASVILIRDVLEVHFPFLYSRDVKTDIETNTGNYGQQIRFTFNLNELHAKNRLHSLLN